MKLREPASVSAYGWDWRVAWEVARLDWMVVAETPTSLPGLGIARKKNHRLLERIYGEWKIVTTAVTMSTATRPASSTCQSSVEDGFFWICSMRWCDFWFRDFVFFLLVRCWHHTDENRRCSTACLLHSVSIVYREFLEDVLLYTFLLFCTSFLTLYTLWRQTGVFFVEAPSKILHRAIARVRSRKYLYNIVFPVLNQR